MEIKCNHKNFVHLVGLYTYCTMMHGAYSVKLINVIYRSVLAMAVKERH